MTVPVTQTILKQFKNPRRRLLEMHKNISRNRLARLAKNVAASVMPAESTVDFAHKQCHLHRMHA